MHFKNNRLAPASLLKLKALFSSSKFIFSALFLLFISSGMKAQTSIKYSVYFDVNQSKIKTKDYLVLDSVVQILKTKTNIKRIQINGYADTTGGADANMELSNNRTDTVAGYILSKNLHHLKNKIATASLGEKVTGKETDLDEMRRVDVVIVMARPDRDTLIRVGCATALVAANTFDGFNNDEISFKLEYINTPADVKKYNITFKDVDGNDLLSNGVVRLVATYKGKPVKSVKPVLINIPKMNNLQGYEVYTGVVDKATKNVTWKATGDKVTDIGMKTNAEGTECDLQSFTINDVNVFKNCDMKRPSCYCSADPFGGLQSPKKTDPFAKFGKGGSVMLITETSFKKVASDKAYVQVVDEKPKEEYMDFCNSFMYPGISSVPSIPKYEREVIRFIDINVSQKNDSADLIMSKKDMVLIMIPKSQLPAHKGKRYAILPADTKKDNFFKWTMKPVFVDSCRGLANCEYLVFEVPFSGFYTVLEMTPVNAKDAKANADGGDEKKDEKYTKIKVKKFNGAMVLYGLKDENTVNDAKFIKNKGKHSILQPAITKKERKNYKEHVFMAYVIKEGKRYAWIGKGSELKKGFFSGNWKTPKLVYVPDEEWENFVNQACQ